MPDPRFYEDLGPVGLAELARLAGAELARADLAERSVARVAILSRAGADSVTFLSDPKLAGALGESGAGAVFVHPKQAELVPDGCAALVTGHPQASYARAAERLHRERGFAPGAPAIDPSATLEDDVSLGPGVIVGAGAMIGRGTRVGPGAVIGPGVAIGRQCAVGANAVVSHALVGDRVKIYAGAIIGEAGFGAAPGPAGIVDLPQLGRVILQDGVTIGAGTTIDRGAYEDTVVGENTKIDNLVQIGHNSVIGRNCVIAGHTGISGSVTVGDGVQMGGGVGIADHLTIGDGAQLAARSGHMQNVPPGERWVGAPARPMRQFFREVAALTRLAESRGGKRGDGERGG